METPTPMPAFAPGERPVLLLDLSGLDDDDNDDDNDNDDDVAVAVGITGMDIVDGPAPVELTIIVAADVVNSDMSFCSYATVIACTHGQMPADGGGSKFCVSGSGEDGRAGLEAGYELTQPAVSGVLVSDEAGVCAEGVCEVFCFGCAAGTDTEAEAEAETQVCDPREARSEQLQPLAFAAGDILRADVDGRVADVHRRRTRKRRYQRQSHHPGRAARWSRL